MAGRARPFTMMEAVSASSWRAGGAASRLTPPTITAWDCFRARAKPLPRLPRRARGSSTRPPKTSPNRAKNDFPRLCPKLAAGVDHGTADDKAQRTGPRNFVLRRDRQDHGSVHITDHAMQSMAIRGFI